MYDVGLSLLHIKFCGNLPTSSQLKTVTLTATYIIYIRTYTHTYINTYMHAYIHTFVHPSIHIYT